MFKTLKTITKEKEICSATNLIKTLEKFKEDTFNEALELDYNPTKQTFKPIVNWDKVNKDEEKILLKFSLEISEYIED